MWVVGLLLGCSGDDTTPTTDSSTTPAHTGDSGPALVTDLFPQDMVTPVDILWVLDGDFDLTGELAEAIDPMWEVLLLADPSWQMGVLDARAGGSRYALITRVWSTWPPPANAWSLPSSSQAARFDETVYSALELRGTEQLNKDFLRSGAALYTIYVTEAEDASNTETISRRNFLEWYAGLSVNARIGVITTGDGRSYWRDRTVGEASMFEVGSEKAAVRGALLEATGLETSFVLSEEPLSAPESVEVIYRDHATEYALDEDYTYDGSTRTLSFKRVIPPPDSIVRVVYEPASSATGTSTATE